MPVDIPTYLGANASERCHKSIDELIEVKMKKRKATTVSQYDQADCSLTAGQEIAQSGIYEICHFDEPRTTVILTIGGLFPQCRKCGARVRYKLLEAIPHISEDPDFKELFNEMHNPPLQEGSAPNHVLPPQLGQAYGFRFQQDDMQAWRKGTETGDLSSRS